MRTALGVYIFAGGFTLGTRRAGFEVLGQLEDGPYGVATTRRNHPDVPVHPDRERWPLAELAGKVDYVYGNPPCAPFSNAGISHKKIGMMGDWWRNDPRAQCVTRMFGVLEAVRPKVWAWESVQPALRRGRELVDELTHVAQALGYQATYVLVNGAHLGVPQVRRRVFFVFHTVAIDWQYDRVPAMTVRDAWEPILSGRVADTELSASGLPPRYLTRDSAYMDVLSRTPPGGSLRRIWEREHPPETHVRTAHGTVRGRPRFLDSRLAWDRPSPTLTGGETKFHPDAPRYITLLEQQLLCGYPEGYVFEGNTMANRRAQTAQAVMPPTGEWLGRNVMRALEADVPADPSAPPTLADLETGHIGPLDAPHPVNILDEALKHATPRPRIAPRPEFPPAVPSQESALPTWETHSGPTALAKVLIAEGHQDGPILAATGAAIRGAKAAGATWPHLFTKTDLARLRARIAKQIAA